MFLECDEKGGFMSWIRGTELSKRLQREVLSIFAHRYTGDHRPSWSNQEWKDGKPYPLQFANDLDWLANTSFPITEKGTIDRRVDHCYSNPTWPENPELRTA